MPGLRKVTETGMGALGHADPVAWQAMQDVMHAKIAHRNVSRNLARAREDGQVVTSLALCRDQMRIEAHGNEAVAVCGRVAGEKATVAALRFAE